MNWRSSACCCLFTVLALQAGSALPGDGSIQQGATGERQPEHQPVPTNTAGKATDWILAFNGIATLLIACAVAYITYQQHLTNREKLRLDLFDKRFRVYAAARDFLAEIFGTGSVTQDQVLQFMFKTSESVFLFPNNDIDKRIVEMCKQANGLQLAKGTVEHTEVSDPSHAKAAQDLRAILDWFSEQGRELIDLFAPYLRFQA